MSTDNTGSSRVVSFLRQIFVGIRTLVTGSNRNPVRRDAPAYVTFGNTLRKEIKEARRELNKERKKAEKAQAKLNRGNISPSKEVELPPFRATTPPFDKETLVRQRHGYKSGKCDLEFTR
jgi:hypothetical protein